MAFIAWFRSVVSWFGISNERRVPLDIKHHPPGAGKIIANETMERFSYYGMRTILAMVLIKFLPFDELMTEQEASGVFHQFAAWNYFFPLVGAIIADVWLGKYRTILYLSLVYTLGCAVLAFDQSRTSIYLGLTLIAIGSGGIKPAVQPALCDQYGKQNKGLINKAVAWFYQGVNAGGLVSVLLTPVLLDKFGPRVAFAVPAVGMFLATVVFWSGRNNYAHIPPKGLGFLVELKQQLKPMVKLIGLFLFMAAFFALYDQSGSEWVIQATKMDLQFLGMEWLPSQIQVVNPLLIVIFAGPIENRVFPLLKKIHPSDMFRIAIGFFLTVASFGVVTWTQYRIEGGTAVNIGWQILAYVILTMGEVLAYLSALQLSYRKAPNSMKSFVGAIFLLGVWVGNLFTSGINMVIQNDPPAFTPDKVGTYMLSLTASDGQSQQVGDVEVTVLSEEDYMKFEEVRREEQKAAQVKFHDMSVDAGRMRAVSFGMHDVPLFGSVAEGDVKGDKGYAWEIVSSPGGSQLTSVDVTGKERRIATFTPDVMGTYRFRLSAKIGNKRASAETEVIVGSENLPPVVNAGDTLTVRVGDEVVLDGNATYDPNGDDLVYAWAIKEVPEASAIRTADISNGTNSGAGTWLKGSYFYLFFTLLMLVVSLIFIPFAVKVDLGPDCVQGEEQKQDADNTEGLPAVDSTTAVN